MPAPDRQVPHAGRRRRAVRRPDGRRRLQGAADGRSSTLSSHSLPCLDRRFHSVGLNRSRGRARRRRAVGHAGAAVWHRQWKTPYRDGTTHVIFEPLDVIARLAALVPKPRVNLTRFDGVFAASGKHRTRVTPGQAGQGRPASHEAGSGGADAGRTPRRHDLGAAPQAGLWHGHRDLPGLRRGRANPRLHRRPGGDREDPCPPGCESG